MRKNMHKPPKRSNFAIRKLAIGAAAVLLVGPLIGARTQNVQASGTAIPPIAQVETGQRDVVLQAATVVGIIPTAASVSSNRPQGATATWVREPDVSKKGTSRGRVRITGQSALGIPFAYEQWVDVTVYAQNEWYDPKVTDLTTEVGSPLEAAKAVANLNNLPQGTNISWAIEPNWAKAGNYSAQIQVTYPDQTLDIATVQVNVKETSLSEKYQPQVTDLVTSVGKKVSATAAVTNAAHLPAGTKITWAKEPDTTKAGSTTGTVLVTYPDNSTDQAVVNVQVKEEPQKPTDADRFTPDFQDLETTVGNKLPAEEAVKNKGQDWRVVWHEAPDFEKPGVYQVTVKVFYPDGSHDEGRVKVTVKAAEAELEEITDHTQHADLVKKVTRTIHVHHPAGDKEPILQTAFFTRTKFVNKETGAVHHYTDWQAQKDSWEEYVPEKVAGHTHLIDGLASEKVAAKIIDPNKEDHKDEVVHINYQALPVLPIDPVDPNPGVPTDPVEPVEPAEPGQPDRPNTPDTPDTEQPIVNTPVKDVNYGSTNSAHRPGLLPLPVANTGTGQDTVGSSNPVGVSESSSLGLDDDSGYLGAKLPQTGWGHVLAGVVITIWCVLFGLAIRENISPDKKREEE